METHYYISVNLLKVKKKTRNGKNKKEYDTMVRRLLLDCETTGINPSEHQILTVALLYVDITDKDIFVLDSLHLKIKHKDYVYQEQALSVNGINLEQHSKDPESMLPPEACNRIRTFMKIHRLSKEPICGQNINFDLAFLKALFKSTDIPYPFSFRNLDTMCVWFFLKDIGRIPSFVGNKLEDMTKYFNISYDGAHDAMADCHITAKVYQKFLFGD